MFKNEHELEDFVHENNVILLTRFGSHLYGTDTPTSDVDYKGIFIPSLEDILLNRVKKSINFDSNKSNEKNGTGDIDCELYSIHHFFHLASKGETVTIDLLHVSMENILHMKKIWERIHENRSMFYTSEMNALVGYARKQAAKYGLRGSRLNAADSFLKLLKSVDPEQRMSTIWKELPVSEHCQHMEYDPDQNGIYHYNFCGKIVQSTAKVCYVIDMVEKFIDQYGHRAKLARQNLGVDWKAISHAIRAAYQLIEIYCTGDLHFPLSSKVYIKRVKSGVLDFGEVIAHLEELMEIVERLSETSTYPKAVDKEKVDKLLLDILYDYYNI